MNAMVHPMVSVVLPELDLARVEQRLRKDAETKHWSDADYASALFGYRLFWALCKSSPRDRRSPTKPVDAVWHAHILVDTRQYTSDCMAYFGRFLHHVALGEEEKERFCNNDPPPCRACVGDADCDGPLSCKGCQTEAVP